MSGVLCCGNLVIDILVRPVDRFPWGTTTLVDAIEQHLGGNGASTSYTLGKLELPCAWSAWRAGTRSAIWL